MWFGDLVTMRWWNDLWLNESFAEWASHWCNTSATRFTDAWTTFLSVRKNWGYRQDQLSSTHPVYCEMPDLEAVEVNFDGITYAKGASVIKQLVAYVGLDAVPGRAARRTSPSTPGATPPSTTCSPSWRRPPAGSCASSPRSGWRPRRSTRCGRWSRSAPDGTYASVVVQQEAPADVPDAAHPPDRRRPVRPGRRPAGPARPARDGRDRRAHRDPGAGRASGRPTCCCSTTTT